MVNDRKGSCIFGKSWMRSKGGLAVGIGKATPKTYMLMDQDAAAMNNDI